MICGRGRLVHSRQDHEPSPQLLLRQLPAGQLLLRVGDAFVAKVLDNIEFCREVRLRQAGEALADGGEDAADIRTPTAGVVEAEGQKAQGEEAVAVDEGPPQVHAHIGEYLGLARRQIAEVGLEEVPPITTPQTGPGSLRHQPDAGTRPRPICRNRRDY